MSKSIHIHVHTRDAGEFKESDHPRAKNGQFGSGGGGGGGGSAKPAAKSAHANAAKPKTFREVLDNPEHRKMVNSIEEYISDLRHQPGRKEHIEGLQYAVKELEKASGFKYDVDPEVLKPAKTGSTSMSQKAAANKEFHAKQAAAETKAHADLSSHPNYSKADHNYLKGKGWTAGEIKARWDEEAKAGHKAQQGNKHAKPGEPGYMKARP